MPLCKFKHFALKSLSQWRQSTENNWIVCGVDNRQWKRQLFNSRCLLINFARTSARNYNYTQRNYNSQKQSAHAWRGPKPDWLTVVHVITLAKPKQEVLQSEKWQRECHVKMWSVLAQYRIHMNNYFLVSTPLELTLQRWTFNRSVLQSFAYVWGYCCNAFVCIIHYSENIMYSTLLQTSTDQIESIWRDFRF